MDKIQLLRARREALEAEGKEVRGDIADIVDEDSFVELAAFTFSKSAFFDENANGEGIVAGFATVGGYPFYIVAQNFAQFDGGATKAGCDKIVKVLDSAQKQGLPVIYLLHSHGVRVEEGVHVLEGIGALLRKATELKGSVLQFAIVNGEVYGSSAALASVCDVVIFPKNGVLCPASPFVLSARDGKNLKPDEVGGYGALKNSLLPAVEAEDLRDAAVKIMHICDLVKVEVPDAELNDPLPALNEHADAATLMKIFDQSVELGAMTHPEVKTVLGRIGGSPVAAVLFDRAKLTEGAVKKVKIFARFAANFGLPFVTFVDSCGLEETRAAADSALLQEIGEYLIALDEIGSAKIAVVTDSAVGLSYSLFAAKSAGFDYTFAFATAKIALFEDRAGAAIELGKQDAYETYAEENADPFNAARGGYLDDIIEPQFLKQYLIAALETLK